MKEKLHWFKNLVTPLLLILLSQGIGLRWDMTQDRRFSLNENTKTLLKGLEQPLKIDIFLTGKLPADYHRLQRETITLIKGMEELTDKLVVSYIDPFKEAASTDELIEEMTQFGMIPEYIVSEQNQAMERTVVFPWAMINDGRKTFRIPLLEKVLGDDEQQKINRSIAQLNFIFLMLYIK